MSDLIGGTTPLTSLVEAVDRRVDFLSSPILLEALWPAARLAGGFGVLRARAYEIPKVIASGRRGDKLIVLTAVDSAGAPLAGVTVKAFRTADDVNNSLVRDTQDGPSVVSAADGQFTIPVPNADAHYVVAYLAGTPDVAGTTVNTLVGS